MGLFLTGILFHEPHEENEQNRCGSNTNDNRDHHNSSAYQRIDCYITVAHCNLRDDLVIEAGDEGVKFGVDLAMLGRWVPLDDHQDQRQEEVVEHKNYDQDYLGFFVDEEFECVECSEFDRVESGKAIGAASIEHFEVYEEFEEVDAPDEDVGRQKIVYFKEYGVSCNVLGLNEEIIAEEGVGGGDDEEYLKCHEDELVLGLPLVVLLLLDPLDDGQFFEDDSDDGEDGEQKDDGVQLIGRVG